MRRAELSGTGQNQTGRRENYATHPGLQRWDLQRAQTCAKASKGRTGTFVALLVIGMLYDHPFKYQQTSSGINKDLYKKNKYTYFLFILLRELISISFLPDAFSQKREKNRRPVYLSLPITNKCNFNCKMCGIPKMYNEPDYTPEELEHILNNELFMNIQSVGIHGGEPFLKSNLVDYVEVIIKVLPKLKILEFTSNGYFTENIINMLSKIKQLCNQSNIKLMFSVSLDAVGKLQDFIRGKRESFSQIQKTCEVLLQNPIRYYDHFHFICTLTKYNIYNVNEVELYGVEKGINVIYDIAVENGRLRNADKYSDFTIFSDPLAVKMTQEFFLRNIVKHYLTNISAYIIFYSPEKGSLSVIFSIMRH
jgi:sulfatase maturation enzyme AslB (radical SAM superfamily)